MFVDTTQTVKIIRSQLKHRFSLEKGFMESYGCHNSLEPVVSLTNHSAWASKSLPLAQGCSKEVRLNPRSWQKLNFQMGSSNV